MTGPAKQIHVEFVCTGNICRSPMAEVIFQDAIDKAGLSEDVRVTSSGTGDWHVGHGADERAVAELASAGYDGSRHRANQFGAHGTNADLLVALDTGHRSHLIARGADEERVKLLRDFDPAAGENQSVADPYYGGPEGFVTTREQIEAAVPGMLVWVKGRVGK